MAAPDPLAVRPRIGSDRADVLGLRALRTLGDVELDSLVLVERTVAVGRDRGEVDEDVSAATVLGDEAKALLTVEPFHCALRHLSCSFCADVGAGGCRPGLRRDVVGSDRVQNQKAPSGSHSADVSQHTANCNMQPAGRIARHPPPRRHRLSRTRPVLLREPFAVEQCRACRC